MSNASFTTPADEAAPPTRAMLIALLVGASLAFSMAFACATPFAALAAVATQRMKRIDALLAVTLAWSVNQADGFLFMHYPRTWETFGWGFAIWVAAIAAALAGWAGPRRNGLVPRLVTACVALAEAILAYEMILFAATAVLPSSAGAFSASVIGRIVTINALAFVLLHASIGSLDVISRRLQHSMSSASGRKSVDRSIVINSEAERPT